MNKKLKIAPITDEEEAEIQREIANNPDTFEATDEMLAHPISLAEVMRRGRGRPPMDSPKQQVSVRLDADVLSTLKAGGPGWQGRMNSALRKALGL